MKNHMLITAILILGLVLAGCATSRVVPEPQKITFEAAMEQIANGLNKMYDIGKDHPKSGLTPSEVTVEFNISADATDNGKLSIEAGANVLDALQVTKAGAEAGSEMKASRGNKITIKFTNLFLSANKDSLIMVKTPQEIAELLKVLKDIGYQPVYKLR
ncbi:MAG: hypothetical protein A4E64_01470 [Syntrophorhabdus sp. PtaU1.Bin058]|nr:MAG: hypothetical protein A4E64_01470 [Syntrophorhabdus sp. PtaU1.Bin058]